MQRKTYITPKFELFKLGSYAIICLSPNEGAEAEYGTPGGAVKADKGFSIWDRYDDQQNK